MKTGDFDIGIAHDGDADRVVFIDEQGNFIDGDTALALFSKEFLKKGRYRCNTGEQFKRNRDCSKSQ
ncbi:Alpha-D-phosphohexomutase, alpha/beta/alpha domain protein II domain protein [mine drainage metagenome]|uniref:Alpha-D-phosphohexomutase, alpha/beta/alpha domain protein II domain protein n=1 Tax=mine drainage metagenome TaxID=410659 RepID=T1CDA1_9ZZZZ